MGSPDLVTPWPSSTGYSFSGSLDIRLEEATSADILTVLELPTSSNCSIPNPPPLPHKTFTRTKYANKFSDSCFVPKETVDTWDKLFNDGLGADVYVITEDQSCVPAHSSILVSSSYFPISPHHIFLIINLTITMFL